VRPLPQGTRRTILKDKYLRDKSHEKRIRPGGGNRKKRLEIAYSGGNVNGRGTKAEKNAPNVFAIGKIGTSATRAKKKLVFWSRRKRGRRGRDRKRGNGGG